MPRSFVQTICWWTKAPNFSQTPSTIACRRLACQQYQAAFGRMACSMAALMKPPYSSGPWLASSGDGVAFGPILILVGPALLRWMVGAVVRHQIRWITCEENRLLIVHDADDVVRLGAVAAQETVIAEQPQIARARYRVRWRLGHDVFAGETTVVAVEWRRQPIELFLVETGEVEIEPGGVECVQFRCQQLLIPLTRQHQLVIGNAVRPHLLCAQVRQPNDRNFCEPQVLRREETAVAGDHLAILGDQQRHGPAVA